MGHVECVWGEGLRWEVDEKQTVVTSDLTRALPDECGGPLLSRWARSRWW